MLLRVWGRLYFNPKGYLLAEVTFFEWYLLGRIVGVYVIFCGRCFLRSVTPLSSSVNRSFLDTTWRAEGFTDRPTNATDRAGTVPGHNTRVGTASGQVTEFAVFTVEGKHVVPDPQEAPSITVLVPVGVGGCPDRLVWSPSA